MVAPDVLRQALAELKDVPVFTDDASVQRASRDMSAVLSPTLAASFADRVADAVVAPRDEAEVLQVMATAATYKVPLIPRGAGTCNFGQSIPLQGGLVLDLRGLRGMVDIQPGRWRAKSGALLSEVADALAPSGQELRVFPSSVRIGTVGGYVGGGHAGIGAIRHGVIADVGNLLGLRVITAEPTPRILEVRGDDLSLVHFSFGTTGVITEVEMPAAPAVPWRDVCIAFPTLAAATEFALAVMLADGIDVKNVHPVDAGMAASFEPLALPAGQAAALCMVAPQSLEPLLVLAGRSGGSLASNVATGSGPRGVPLYEYTWGHSVWWLRKTFPNVATSIALLPESDPIGTLATLLDQLEGRSWIAVSCKKFAGRPALQLALCVDTTDRPDALHRAAAIAAELGCLVADTHRPVLSTSSIYDFDARQSAFRAEVDPFRLLNPGKIDGEDASEVDSALSGGLTASGFSSRRT